MAEHNYPLVTLPFATHPNGYRTLRVACGHGVVRERTPLLREEGYRRVGK